MPTQGSSCARAAKVPARRTIANDYLQDSQGEGKKFLRVEQLRNDYLQDSLKGRDLA
jgi:hypothetical protein